MSSVFLFGAGASYGSGPCYPHPPPLGADLFAALRSEGGVAASVSDDLAAAFAKDFEAGMDRFLKERNSDAPALLREMAAYFARFEPRDGNAYIELLRILGAPRKKATFVTTNYDLLIELAANYCGLRTSYTGLPVSANNIPILKIHGSCNFLPDLGGGSIRRTSFATSASPSAIILDAPVRIAKSAAEVRDFCRREDSLAPALAMYSLDKRVLFCPKFIISQRRSWEASLRRAAGCM
jgi:hypothetical protein